jgi:hypothetical protein
MKHAMRFFSINRLWLEYASGILLKFSAPPFHLNCWDLVALIMAGNSAGNHISRYLNSQFLLSAITQIKSSVRVSLSQFPSRIHCFLHTPAVPLKLMKCNFEFRPTCSKVKWASKAKAWIFVNMNNCGLDVPSGFEQPQFWILKIRNGFIEPVFWGTKSASK